MTRITTEKTGTEEYTVAVTDDRSTSVHRVTADAAEVRRLAPGIAATDVITASFRFLLDREPKESILRTFALTDISRYFPDFEAKLSAYLADG